MNAIASTVALSPNLHLSAAPVAFSDTHTHPKCKFSSLGLDPVITKAVKEAGYTAPSPIQELAIPELINGSDVFASADTGTGKTAAFMLPALQKLIKPSDKQGKGPRILVLTPTRELATQITTAARNYGKFIPRVKTVSILGGMPYHPQEKDLRHYVDIVVATPGRLLDHTREGKVDYSRVELFVLDEADRMLDMGFVEDVEEIAKQLPKDRQTVLFSATLKKVAGLASRITKNPKTIQIKPSETTNDNVKQQVIFANDESHKRKLLAEIIKTSGISQAIVFSGTKSHTEVLADELEMDGVLATAIHGDLRQRSREAIIRKLRSNRIQVLVATDVASRGIDVPGLSHVINYDLPRTAEDYTHRIGRTGRAGASGVAITFVQNNERHKFKTIERVLGHQVEVITIPGLEAKEVKSAPRNERSRSGRSGGGRRRNALGRENNRSGRSFGKDTRSSDRSNSSHSGRTDSRRSDDRRSNSGSSSGSRSNSERSHRGGSNGTNRSEQRSSRGRNNRRPSR
jgi:superfamily II DNA/RNA helicase